MEKSEVCQVCKDMEEHPGRYQTGTGVVTCRCGVRHEVGRVDMRTKPAPEYVTGRYRKADLSWRSAMPKGRRSRVRRGKLFDSCPDFRE